MKHAFVRFAVAASVLLAPGFGLWSGFFIGPVGAAPGCGDWAAAEAFRASADGKVALPGDGAENTWPLTNWKGIPLHLVAADYLRFLPKKVLETWRWPPNTSFTKAPHPSPCARVVIGTRGGGAPVNSHKNARLTFEGRRILVSGVIHEGLPVREAAGAQGVSPRTAYKWLLRYRGEGEDGLLDRSSRPRRSPRKTPAPVRERVIELRRQRWPYHAIAFRLGLSKSTVGRILKKKGLNRLSLLEPKPPVRRYEVAASGMLLHLDTKKLARFERPGHRVTRDRRRSSPGAGYEVVYAAVDAKSRLAYVAVRENERVPTKEIRY